MYYVDDGQWYHYIGLLDIQFNSIQFNSVYWPIKGPQGATGKLSIDE